VGHAKTVAHHSAGVTPRDRDASPRDAPQARPSTTSHATHNLFAVAKLTVISTAAAHGQEELHCAATLLSDVRALTSVIISLQLQSRMIFWRIGDLSRNSEPSPTRS
jgi:hypothetical protein